MAACYAFRNGPRLTCVNRASERTDTDITAIMAALPEDQLFVVAVSFAHPARSDLNAR
jgi:hypothetical protein